MKRLFDSKDIQSYVESINYDFSPAEEIVLIALSNRTLDEKLELYQEYVDIYSDNELRAEETTVISWSCNDIICGFNEMLKKIIERYKLMLSEIQDSNGYVYMADIRDVGFEIDPYLIFDSYDSAYQYLVNEKQSYLDDENLKDIITHSEIRKQRLNSIGEEEYSYERVILDDSLEIVDIYPSRKYTEEFSVILTESIYIHVPLPFKAGDIVKSVCDNGNGETIFGVIKEDCAISREDDRWLQGKSFVDGTDIVVDLDRYDKFHKHYFLQHSIPKISLAYADESEIINEDEQNWLRKISYVNDGSENLIWLLMDLR